MERIDEARNRPLVGTTTVSVSEHEQILCDPGFWDALDAKIGCTAPGDDFYTRLERLAGAEPDLLHGLDRRIALWRRYDWTTGQAMRYDDPPHRGRLQEIVDACRDEQSAPR